MNINNMNSYLACFCLFSNENMKSGQHSCNICGELKTTAAQTLPRKCCESRYTSPGAENFKEIEEIKDFQNKYMLPFNNHRPAGSTNVHLINTC